MSDDLSIPQVPEAKPNDPEDVSWALSTAEAMWARGDHAEGIKWVRRAAEAASEAEQDSRALELAKAAADLAGLLSRRTSASVESIELDDTVALKGPPPVPARASAFPSPKPASLAPKPGAPKPISAVSPSRVPAPIPARPSAAPPATTTAANAKKPVPPAAESSRPAPAPAKAATTTTPKATPAPAKSSPAKRSSRKSRENLDAEARAAALATDIGSSTELLDTAETVSISVPHRRKSRPDDIKPPPPTTGRISMPPSSRSPVVSAQPAGTLHDPNIATSQAVRVVVWRDANGVHLAPAGTVVSAISVDAILVALEPSADLTAWLGAQGTLRR